MAAHPTLDQSAAEIRAWQTREPGFAKAAAVGAKPLIEIIRERLPDADPTVIGAVLLAAAGVGSYLVETCDHPELFVNILGCAGADLYLGAVSDAAL